MSRNLYAPMPTPTSQDVVNKYKVDPADTVLPGLELLKQHAVTEIDAEQYDRAVALAKKIDEECRGKTLAEFVSSLSREEQKSAIEAIDMSYTQLERATCGFINREGFEQTLPGNAVRTELAREYYRPV